MTKLTFLFGVHNHQPEGNFLSVFEKAFKDCYRPFLEEMDKHPLIKFTLHFSGPLWEYMEKREKRSWEILERMVEREQVELLSGGFYEPILSIIPEEDRIGQIKLMNDFLRQNFKTKPRGLWLTERIWEPHLPKTLSKAGIEYTLLDEEHFHYAGVKDIHTFYLTEEEGHPLNLFPIDKKLRYLIPFRKLEEIKAYFQEIEDRGGVAILGDDGEKFGLWPGTKKWVYEEGWLRTFLEFLENEGIRTLTYSEFLGESSPAGKVYLPPASYEEMMEWVLEPEDYENFKKLKETSPKEAKRFLRGGYFKEFFLKYPEGNHLHKRMLLVSQEVAQNPSEKAQRELYRGQCNDAYWHGIFGGLYLPHLRESAYHHLLEAEKSLPLRSGWTELDYDFDGKKEVFYRGEDFNLLVKPAFGGAVAELDYKPISRNLSDVLSRRKESYHSHKEEERGEGKSIHELAKEFPPQAKDLLKYDWYPRFSLLDHFLYPNTQKRDFMRIDYGEQGDFVNQAYHYNLIGNRLALTRQGGVWIRGERLPVAVRKEISAEKDRIRFCYEIENLAEKEITLTFGSEWNLYLISDELEIRAGRAVLLSGKISWEPSSPDEFWHFPLQTLSQSEEGYDIIQQGICLLPLWKFKLSQKEKFSCEIVLRKENGK
jgi:hypothetical protein